MFKRILVAYAFDQGSEAALGLAKLMLDPEGTLHLVHVIDDVTVGLPYDALVYMGDVAKAAEDRLVALEQKEGGPPRVRHSVVKGSVWRGVLEAVRGAKAQAIFIGSHGRRGAARLLLGSVAERVMRESPVPVCVVKQAVPGTRLRRIGLATDLGPSTAAAVQLARALVRDRDGKLFVIHVVDEEPTPGVEAPRRKRIDEQSDAMQMARKLEKEGVRVREVVPVGNAPEKIAAVARRHGLDLLVMGTHARKGLQHLFMGSVAAQTIRLAPCPVLVVRSGAGG